MRAAGARAVALLAACLIWVTAAADPQVFDPSRSDPRAIAITDLVLSALGGRQAWEETRFLYFAFAVERDGKRVAYRTHLWDR